MLKEIISMKNRKETKPETVSGPQQDEQQDEQQWGHHRLAACDPEDWRDGVEAIVYGVDRFTVWFDAIVFGGLRECLEMHCLECDISEMNMVGNAKWKMKVEIHLPNHTLYKALHNLLSGRASMLITYVEFSADVIMLEQSNAVQAARNFVYLATVPDQRDYVEAYENTFYYAGRTPNRRKRGNALVVCGDNTSKLGTPLGGSPALHFEWRTAGSTALSKEGVVTLADLGAFDHKAFWAQKLRFYWIAAVMRAADVTLTQFRKWCRRSPQKAEQGLFPKMVVAEQFCMQNFVKEMPSIVDSVRAYEFEYWVKQSIW
jgi:hypothetical protein